MSARLRCLFIFLFISVFANAQQYCFPHFGNRSVCVDHFEFNSILNTFSGENGDVTVYSLNEFTTTVSLGETYTMQMASIDMTYGRLAVWIDYNNSGTYDTNEKVMTKIHTNYCCAQISIPNDSSFLGYRKMRVLVADGSGPVDPCGSYASGEAEEYFIRITANYVEPCYCTPFKRDASFPEIIRTFMLKDIRNCSSGYDTLTMYTFYPDSVLTTDLELGETYDIFIQESTSRCDKMGISAYIDYNNDQYFAQSEKIVHSSNGPHFIHTTFTVPIDSAYIGKRRLRVRMGPTYVANSSCSWDFSETEDYIVNIVALDTNIPPPPAEWEKIVSLPQKQTPYDMVETYDKGYAVVMSDGLNIPNFRLIKLSVDGDTLWSRRKQSIFDNYPVKIEPTHDGGLVLTGYSYEYDAVDYHDTYVVKLDACGNEVWTGTYGGPITLDMPADIHQCADSNYILLVKLLSPSSFITLFKLDTSGNVLWFNDYTHNLNHIADEVLETQDGGFLLTGYIYTQHTSNGSKWSRSMVLRTDAAGNELWMKVLKADSNMVSAAKDAIELPSGNFLVVSEVRDIQKDHFSLGVFKLNAMGDTISFNTISDIPKMNVQNGKIKKLSNNKYCIVATGRNGCAHYASHIAMFMIDTNAVLLDSVYVTNYYSWPGGFDITHDKKIVVSGFKVFPNNVNMYLYKFNEFLEFDTLYNVNLLYDSLCGITVEQIDISMEELNVDVYPNPSCEGINVLINGSCNEKYMAEIISMEGRKIECLELSSNQRKYISLTHLMPGIYFLNVYQDGQRLSSRKFVVAR